MGFDFNSLGSNLGNLMALQQKGAEAKAAFDNLRGAIDSTNFNAAGSSKFANIVNALDKILQVLKSLQGMKGVPSEAAEATKSGIVDVQGLKADVQAGKIASQDDMHERVDELIAKYKDQLGPLASALE